MLIIMGMLFTPKDFNASYSKTSDLSHYYRDIGICYFHKQKNQNGKQQTPYVSKDFKYVCV